MAFVKDAKGISFKNRLKHGTVKTLSDLLHLHCGTASHIISGLKIASLNSRVFCSPGMGPNVAVLHVDN
jgi:hypothetical protein